ncbi:MAG: PP2C family protein-serine/threonine phosphatase [Bryobacteraceae bacterium]
MLEAVGLSDPGCVRNNNEDYFICDAESGLFILADGMGGAHGGEHASRISAEMLYRFLRQLPGARNIETLERGFTEANSAVRQAARDNPGLEGMGTTLIAARAVGEGHFQIVSVGDSRAYLNSTEGLSLLTRDQTWVAEVGSGLGLSEESLRKHPYRHVLTMAVGSAEEIRIPSQELHIRTGDQILLCSDGLHGVVDQRILQEVLNSPKSLPEKCHYLVEAAKNAGGPDNITVVLIQAV